MAIEFGRGVVRFLAVGLTFALLGSGQLEAQTVPPCKTTAGDSGLFFAGTFALIFSPVAFDEVRSQGAEIQVFSDVRDGLGVLSYLGKPSEDSVVEFVAEGAVVHQCLGRIVAFDPKRHDMAQLQSGDCGWQLVSGRKELLAGHAQVLEFPEDFSEISISAPRDVDISTLSSRLLYLHGNAPGLAVIAWFVEGEPGAYTINLCPITAISPEAVLAAGGPTDAELCQDADGAPMRLGVGQVARMAFRDAAGDAMEYQEAAMADATVAEFNFDDTRGARVTGLAAGWTSLTLVAYSSEMVTTCEIIVE
jgi:hypothetical protein